MDLTADRRADHVSLKIEELANDLREQKSKIDQMEASLAANTTATAEVLDIIRLGKSFFRIAGYVGSGVKWLSGILAGVLAIWYTFKGPH